MIKRSPKAPWQGDKLAEKIIGLLEDDLPHTKFYKSAAYQGMYAVMEFYSWGKKGGDNVYQFTFYPGRPDATFLRVREWGGKEGGKWTAIPDTIKDLVNQRLSLITELSLKRQESYAKTDTFMDPTWALTQQWGQESR